jgi:hypothetical protein
MQFHIIMPSRGNPIGLSAVTRCMQSLQSGVHDVKYTWIFDEDDPEFSEYFRLSLAAKAESNIAPGDANLYARVNAVAEANDDECSVIVNDDVFPLTHHWDRLAALINCPVFCWQEQAMPSQANYPFIHRLWRKKQGYISNDLFPFWFADSWLNEVFIMAVGQPIPIIEPLKLGGIRGKTKCLRDLRFWFNFYARTRHIRVNEAMAIRGSEINMDVIKEFEKFDALHLANAKLYTDISMVPNSQPSRRYVLAKQRAEMMLARI